MPRPKFAPTDDQRRTIKYLAGLAQQRAKLDEHIDKWIATAYDQEIPISVIAEAVGRQRKTVYRHLGRDM